MPKHSGRCPRCGDDPLYVRCHDEKRGVPERDGRRLFEKLVLEGAQAGLSWITVLRKPEQYREVFDGFDPREVGRYSDAKVAALLPDSAIIRNRVKIAANAASRNGAGDPARGGVPHRPAIFARARCWLRCMTEGSGRRMTP